MFQTSDALDSLIDSAGLDEVLNLKPVHSVHCQASPSQASRVLPDNISRTGEISRACQSFDNAEVNIIPEGPGKFCDALQIRVDRAIKGRIDDIAAQMRKHRDGLSIDIGNS